MSESVKPRYSPNKTVHVLDAAKWNFYDKLNLFGYVSQCSRRPALASGPGWSTCCDPQLQAPA